MVMSVLFVLMFNAKVISLDFHELGGLFVCVLFLFHKLLNWKWIVAVSKKIFNKDLNFKTRLGYIVDFLLLISVTTILVSGIFISKILFRNIDSRSLPWQMIHYFASAVSLILMGIHIGLHWGFVMGMFEKYLKIPNVIATPLSIILVLAIVILGLYNIFTSSFTRWLESPFTSSQMGEFKEKERPANFEFDSGKISENPSEMDLGGKSFEKGEKGKLPEGFDKGQFPEGFQKGNFEGKRSGGNGALSIVITYTSIIGVFGVVTYYIEKLLKRKKSHKTLTISSF
jgi:hypothetical protein